MRHFCIHQCHCSRCHQSVDAQAVSCPYRTPLKAYGHPGIPCTVQLARSICAKAAYTTQTIPVFFLNVPCQRMYALPGRSHQLGVNQHQNQQPRDRCEKLAKTPPDLALCYWGCCPFNLLGEPDHQWRSLLNCFYSRSTISSLTCSPTPYSHSCCLDNWQIFNRCCFFFKDG